MKKMAYLKEALEEVFVQHTDGAEDAEIEVSRSKREG